MAYLVTEHDGELRLVIRMGEQTSGHIDVSARQSECIHDGAVEHPKRERRLTEFRRRVGPAQVAVGQHALSHLANVSRELRVIVRTERREYLLIRLGSQLNLLRPGVGISPLLSCYRTP